MVWFSIYFNFQGHKYMRGLEYDMKLGRHKAVSPDICPNDGSCLVHEQLVHFHFLNDESDH